MTHLTIIKDCGPAKKCKILQRAIVGCWRDDEPIFHRCGHKDVGFQSRLEIYLRTLIYKSEPNQSVPSFVNTSADTIDCREVIQCPVRNV